MAFKGLGEGHVGLSLVLPGGKSRKDHTGKALPRGRRQWSKGRSQSLPDDGLVDGS